MTMLLQPELKDDPSKEKFSSHLKTFKSTYIVLALLVFMAASCNKKPEALVVPKKVNVSSNLFPDFLPYSLIADGGTWHCQSPPKYPEWVEIEYVKPTKITYLAIKSQPDSAGGSEHKRGPKDFVLQGSNSRKSWVDLLKVKDNFYKEGGEWKSWSFKNKSSYAYYRIYMTANCGDPSYLTISQIKIK